jgi:aspartate aminotransferase-like enzyme
MERDGIDLLVSGTQKSFGVPPGGAMVGIGPRGWQALARPGGHHAMSLDLRGERKQATAGDSAFTPAVPLILALDEVMERWHEAGREALFAHQAALSAGTIAAVKALGLSLFATHPSPALTSLVPPAGIRADDLIATMRDRYGVTITGGQDSLKGKILRIGHLGAVDAMDVVATVTALECALADHGFAVSPGAAASAAIAAMTPSLRSAANAIYQP